MLKLRGKHYYVDFLNRQKLKSCKKKRQIKGNLQGQAVKIAEDMKCRAVIHRSLGKRKTKGVFFCIRKVVCNRKMC